MFCLCRLCDLSSRVAAKSDTSRTSFRSIAIGNPLEMSEFHRLRCERRSWADWVQELAITGRPSYQELPPLVSALSIKVWATTPGHLKNYQGAHVNVWDCNSSRVTNSRVDAWVA